MSDNKPTLQKYENIKQKDVSCTLVKTLQTFIQSVTLTQLNNSKKKSNCASVTPSKVYMKFQKNHRNG